MSTDPEVDPRIQAIVTDAQRTVSPRQREIIKLLQSTTTHRKKKNR